MKSRPDDLIKKMLGQDFFEALNKSDVYKMYNKTVTGLDEMATGLKIVPRAVMSFIISNLSHMQNDDNKDLELPFAPDCYLQVVKKGPDVFSGFVYSKGKKINEFVNRSIPGIGLVLMTTFELYETEDLKHSKQKEEQTFDVGKLQEIIDERLRLHSLVSRVVDQKIAQRDAVDILVKEKLAQALADKENSDNEDHNSRANKLKVFLEKKRERTEEAMFEKTENIDCPDCGSNLYKGEKELTLCICYGEDWNKNIKIKKNESSIKMKFPKSMDSENIEMLLQTLKQINNKE